MTKSYQLRPQFVQANKFDQKIREIDGSIAVASGKELQTLQISNTKDLSKIFPGFVLKTPMGSGYIFASIRGLSSDFYNPSMIVYVDGVPQDPAFIAQELLDVQQVELLRGPQGTIWGQNAQAGVLNIITNSINSNKPRVRAIGQFGLLFENAMLSISSPIVKDYVYIGGNFSYNRYNGMINSLDSKNKLDISNEYLGNASIAFAPKSIPFSAIFKYSKDKLYDNRSGFTLNDGQYKDLEVDTNNEFSPYKIPKTTRNIDTYALKLSYNFDHAKIVNTASFQTRDYDQDFALEKLIENRKTLTEELRISADYNNGAYSIFGLYYQNINTDVYGNEINKNTFAIYGDGKIPLWYNFDLSLGARYSYDSSKLKQHIYGASIYDPTAVSADNPYGKVPTGLSLTGRGKVLSEDTREKGTFTPKVSLGYNLKEYARFYALYQIGYKPGGFDYATANKVDPENTQNFELGLHSNFYEDRIAFNLAAYYIHIDNKQTYVGSLGSAILKNVGIVDSKGIEASLHFFLLDSLKISLAGTFGNSRYVKYTDRTNQNLKGNALPYAPDITVNASIDYKFLSFAWANFFINANTNFYSKTYFDETNKLFQNDYALLDGSLRMETKWGLSLDLFIQNALNQKYKNYIIDYTSYGFGKFNIVGDSINFGVNIGYRFE